MCKHPVYIDNPVKQFHVYRDKIGICVPCGHCEECRKSKQLEWFTRAYYEFLDCKRHRGFCVNVTLTYNDDNVPVEQNIRCFDKTHIQLFTKRLQTKVARFLDLPYTECRVRYLICSEYGGETHRPHYHGILFVHRSMSVIKFLEFLKQSWNYGFIAFGKFGALVKDVRAIAYATKYVCKDMDFDDASSHVELSSRFKSFHLQSKGFGAYIIEKFRLLSPVGFQTLVDASIPVADKEKLVKMVQIPYYLQRKCMYNLEYDIMSIANKVRPRFALNSLGISVRKARLEKMYDDNLEIIRDTFNNIENIINDPERLAVFNRNTNSNFTTTSAIRLRFQEVDFEKLSLYSVLFKDRVMLPVGVTCDTDVPYLNLDSYSSLKYQMDIIFNVKDTDCSLNPSEKVVEKYKGKVYNSLPEFINYDYVLFLLESLLAIKAKYHCASLNIALKHQSNLKLLQR